MTVNFAFEFMNKRAQVGSGRVYKEISSAPIEGCDMTPTRPSDQDEDREGFSTKRFISHIAPQNFSKGLAGGNQARFDRLKAMPPGQYPDDGGDTWDQLPGVTP